MNSPQAPAPVPSTASDWRAQLRRSIRTVDALRQRFPGVRLDAEIETAARRFPMAITPYYAGLIRRPDPSDPVFAQCVPTASECETPDWLRNDPLHEQHDTPVPGLVHRYPDRALLLVTSRCAVYCRHCTRKRVAGDPRQPLVLGDKALERCVAYLRGHPGIVEVIVSGGDPLTLETPVLERILAALRSVPSIEVLRIGTRVPVTLPMRVDADLALRLRAFAPLYINTHFNHPAELTPEAVEALGRLADAGLPLGNQAVLLRGVNDDVDTLAALFRGLLRARVRPYYLFQCDLVRGTEHFRTPVDRGLAIMRALRPRLSGLAMPHFVVDLPGGAGKVELLPESIVARQPDHTAIVDARGQVFQYPEPSSQCSGSHQRCDQTPV